MSHISMSQHGPLLMGVSDVLSRATSVAAVWAMLRNGQGATDFAGFEAAGVVSRALFSRRHACWVLVASPGLECAGVVATDGARSA